MRQITLQFGLHLHVPCDLQVEWPLNDHEGTFCAITLEQAGSLLDMGADLASTDVSMCELFRFCPPYPQKEATALYCAADPSIARGATTFVLTQLERLGIIKRV